MNLSVNQTFCFIPYRFNQLMLRTAPFPMPTIVQGSSTSLFLWGWSRRVFFWSSSLSQCLSCSAWLQWTDLMIPKVLPSTLQLVRQNWSRWHGLDQLIVWNAVYCSLLIIVWWIIWQTFVGWTKFSTLGTSFSIIKFKFLRCCISSWVLWKCSGHYLIVSLVLCSQVLFFNNLGKWEERNV